MADSPTAHHMVVIEEKGEGWTRYRNDRNGQRWVVRGECNRCGLCQIGETDPKIVWVGPPGTPGAEYDQTYGTRLDVPVLPGFIENMETMARVTPTATVSGCSLTIEEA